MALSDVMMLLCDYAESIAGKLYVMGGGWSACSPGPRNMSIALKVQVPWDETNIKHELALLLQDESGKTVVAGEPPRPVERYGEFEVGRPPGLPPGSEVDFTIAFSFFGVTLEPSRGYCWQLEIDGEPVRRVSFRTAGTPA